MAMTRKNFYFDDLTNDRLNFIAKARKEPRSVTLRDLIFEECKRVAQGVLAESRLNLPADATAAPYAGDRKEALG